MSIFPTQGSNYEVFGFHESELILMDYDVGQNIRLLSLGQFSVKLFMHMTYPILAVFCSVAGFDWPLAKDIVVIRMAERTFAIALPGLLYGLQFPWYCPEALFGRLTRVFKHYSLYMDINDNNQGYPVMGKEPNKWNRLRPQIEPMADEAFKKLGHFPGISQFRILDLNSCFMRAIRMSTTTKLIIESMSNGTLNSSQFKITGVNPRNQAYRSRAYASVSSFSWLVDAIELAWVLYSGFGHLLRGWF
ncbi:hypothetical protein SESBI_36283 [Sesbania bispinosa]|nr:hypothetical protein SESBI_36283 [Sesbania bispinosa]